MTSRLVAAIAAGAVAVGILIGSAGTIIIGAASSPRYGDYMGDYGRMGQMMGSGMMGSGMMDPEDMWALHRAHHGQP